MKDHNILVVEDDQDGQEVVARLLRYHNISFHIVFTAEDALEALNLGKYTGAIFDLALPGMDGWSLLEAVKANPATQELPCVAVTAYHSAEVAVKAIEAGFAAYFPKPLESTSFVRELQRVFN
jgi:CheY-like chemotaxis protein